MVTDPSAALTRIRQLGEAYASAPLDGGHLAHSVRLATSWTRNSPPIQGTEGRLSRKDVFDIATEAVDGTSQLGVLLHSMAWGHGDNGYGPHRTNRILSEFKSDAERDRFVNDLRNAANYGPISGYEALTRGSPKYLGPAFGTKLLYFVSPASDRSPILDSVVSSWLWEQRVASDENWIDSRVFDVSQYARYLEFVERAAEVLSKVCTLEDVGDRGFIEYLIFHDQRYLRATESFPVWLAKLGNSTDQTAPGTYFNA